MARGHDQLVMVPSAPTELGAWVGQPVERG
jgi:hypothetical protein